MTLPRLAVDSPYGRLYRHPTTPMEKIADRTEAYRNGLLVPSVTNIIDVLNKPFLMDWYARLSAQAAVDVSFEHPGLIQQKPDKAKKWISEAAVRYTKQAADLGTRVHDVVEKLSRGETDLYYDSDVQPFVNSWHDFVGTFQPEFLYMEATCYGAVPNNHNSNSQPKLGYAGTTDFICRINGKTYAADYKCVVPDTRILMCDGTEKKASEIQAGDLITGYDEETRSLCVAPVEYVGSNGERPTVILTVSGGRSLQVTEEHPILVAREPKLNARTDWREERIWVEAKNVQVGHYCVLALGYGDENGVSNMQGVETSEALLRPAGKGGHIRNLNLHTELVSVISIEYVSEPTETIAISVTGVHTHVTNGIITHNTGRSIHTEAALQLAALVNSYEIVLDNDQTIEMPKIDGGIVVHLTAKGFSVYPTDPFNEAWETFIDLRQIWDFHVKNLASRQPLFIGNKWKKLSDAE